MLSILKLKKNIINKYYLNKSDIYVGNSKHHIPANKEWFNSVYSYNNNNIKNLPSTDKYVTNLIKNYFNLYNTNLEEKALIPSINIKKRRKAMNRIHVGKPEFKHTNDKVIITLYIFNQQLVTYINKINKIKGLKYLDIFKAKNLKSRPNNLKLTPSFNNKIYLLKKTYSNFFNDIKTLNLNYSSLLNSYISSLDKLPIIFLIRNILSKLRLYLYIKRIIHFNKSKFNSIHIIPFKVLLQKIYGKKVEFNIVSLKDYRLNSTLLTEIIGIKLRNRKNRLLKVLSKVLNFSIPYANKIEYAGSKSNSFNRNNIVLKNNNTSNYFKLLNVINLNNNKYNLKNNIVKKTILVKTLEKDNLNNLLKSIYPNEYVINKSRLEGLFIKKRKLVNTVLERIKNKSVTGIRIEASGRLSKRLVAARSTYKVRHIGTLKNINSSYRKIPSVLLRGNSNANLNYSRYNGKGVTGAFGLKGWVNAF